MASGDKDEHPGRGIILPRPFRARHAADRIRDEPIRRFKPGDHLPGERGLARLLGVSRFNRQVYVGLSEAAALP